MDSLNSIELYNIKQWNRATIADGNYLSGIAIYPLSANDYTLLSAIDTYQNNAAEVAEINHQRNVEIAPDVNKWNTNLRDGIFSKYESYNETFDSLNDYGPSWETAYAVVNASGGNWNAMVSSAYSGHAAYSYLLDPGLNTSKILHSAFYYCANDGKQNWYNDKKHAVYNHSMYIGVYYPDEEENVVTNWSFGIGTDESIRGSSRTTSCCNDHSFAILGDGAGVSNSDIKGRSVNHHFMQCGRSTIGANWTGFYQGEYVIKGNRYSIIHGMNSVTYNERCVYLTRGPQRTTECVFVKGLNNGYDDTARQFLIGDYGGTHHNKNVFALVYGQGDDPNASSPVAYSENTFAIGGTGSNLNSLYVGGYSSQSNCVLSVGRHNEHRTNSTVIGNNIGYYGVNQTNVGCYLGCTSDNAIILGKQKSSYKTYQILDLTHNVSNGASDTILIGKEYSTVSNSNQCFYCGHNTNHATTSYSILHTNNTNNVSTNSCLVHGHSHGSSSSSWSMILGTKGQANNLSQSLLCISNFLPICEAITPVGSKMNKVLNLRYSGDYSFVMNDFSFTFASTGDKPNSHALTNPGDYNSCYHNSSLIILDGYEILNHNSFRDLLVGRSNYQTGGIDSGKTSFHSYHDEDTFRMWSKYNICVGDFLRHNYRTSNATDWSKMYDFEKSFLMNVGNNSHAQTQMTGTSYYTVSDANVMIVGSENKLGYNNSTGTYENPDSKLLYNLIIGDNNDVINAIGSECVVVGKNNKISIPWATCSYSVGSNPTMTAKMICIGENCSTLKTMKRRCIAAKTDNTYVFDYSKSNTQYNANDYLTKLIESIKGLTTDEVKQTQRAAYFLATQNLILSKSDGPYFVVTTCQSTNGSNRNGVYFRKTDNRWYDVATNTAIT